MPQCRDHLGKEYPSLAAMARAYGFAPVVLATRLSRGWDPETALLTPARKRRSGACTDHLGNRYTDLKAMARAYGMDGRLLRQRLSRGWRTEEALTVPVRENRPKPCRDHLGREFPSMSSMAVEYDINLYTLQKRLKAGLSLQDALTLPNAQVTRDHLGNIYPSEKAMPTVIPESSGIFSPDIPAHIHLFTVSSQGSS